jgi:hypothetical protein
MASDVGSRLTDQGAPEVALRALLAMVKPAMVSGLVPRFPAKR